MLSARFENVKLPADYVVPASSSDTPGIAYVSNIRDANGEPTGVIPDGEMWFHHDTCYTDAPDKFTMLCALAVPKTGGNTMWCNMYQAWETMPEDLKQTIRGKKALSVYDYATIEKPDLDNLENIEKAWQPCVVTHPQTGREALFVNRLMTCPARRANHRGKRAQSSTRSSITPNNDNSSMNMNGQLVISSSGTIWQSPTPAPILNAAMTAACAGVK